MVRQVSNPIFTFPKRTPIFWEIARINASAGSMITSAITSSDIPNAAITHPITR